LRGFLFIELYQFPMRPFLITINVLLFFSCSDLKYNDLLLDQLSIDPSKNNGYLINRDNGLHRLKGFNETDSSFGILAVHGFYPKLWKTKGLEWVAPLRELTKLKRPIWWVKYDWFDCPDSSAQYLSKKIDDLIAKNPHLDSLWVIGHSQGGYIVSNLAETWKKDFPLTIHAIAAPLKGMENRSFDCDLFEKDNYSISSKVTYTQWSTIYKQDGAFKQLDHDPQNVLIDNGNKILLPIKWNGKRLGHNYSIEWVIDQLKRRNN